MTDKLLLLAILLLMWAVLFVAAMFVSLGGAA